MEEACTNFRAYLHSSGVSEALSMALLSLYKLSKKPTNPIEYIRQNLPPEQAETIAGLTNQLEDLKKDIEKLKKMLPKEMLPVKAEEAASQMGAESTFDGTETVFSDVTSTIAETVFSDATTTVADTVITEATAVTDAVPETIVDKVTESVISEAKTGAADRVSISSKANIAAAEKSSISSKTNMGGPETASISSKMKVRGAETASISSKTKVRGTDRASISSKAK